MKGFKICVTKKSKEFYGLITISLVQTGHRAPGNSVAGLCNYKFVIQVSMLIVWQSYGHLRIAIWHLLVEIASLYGDSMEPCRTANPIQIFYRHPPAPTDLTEYPNSKNFFCFGVSQKMASVVASGISFEVHLRRPIFGKMFLQVYRNIGGVLILRFQ